MWQKLGHELINDSPAWGVIISALDSVNEIWLHFASVYQEGDDKIIRIVKIAGLHRKSSQWGVIETLENRKAPFCLARSWCKYRSSRQIWKKSNLGFVNFNSYFMLRAVTKGLVILTLHSTCKAYMIEKIMVEVIWWKLLAYVCEEKFAHAMVPDGGRSFSPILYRTEPWMMNRNHLHYHHFFYLSKPTESIPSQAHQLIC